MRLDRLLAFALLLAPGGAGAERVNVGNGRAIGIDCSGARTPGAPTIILTAGMGDDGTSWGKVRPALAALGRTCSWDRAGLGDSDPSPEPQTVAATTADLETALRLAGIDPPYVLVGHSIGSFETMLFAYRRPADVAGIVLVDPSTPFQRKAFASAAPRFAARNAERLSKRTVQLRACAAAWRDGHDADGCEGESSPGAIARAEAVASMTEAVDASSAMLLESRRRLAMPMIVLTATGGFQLPSELADEQGKVVAAWSAMHAGLAGQSPLGRQQIAEGSGHYIHQERPDTVAAAVKAVIEQTGARR